jgi:hypothetical protein
MAGRTLHVRCGTWEQVEQFTQRKLRKGRLLSMKVPFAANVGTPVTLGLELPSEMVIAIDGVVQKASPVEIDGKPDGHRTWIEIELTGFTDDVRVRLEMLAKKRDEAETVAQPAAPPRRPSTSQMGEELPEDERALFQHLSNELRRLRQAAVHDVLGVAANAGPSEVRLKWKEMIQKNHPDLVARRGAPAITHLAEELTILANRAYDRMRANLVAQGRGAVAGPGIAQPPGWLVGFEDLQSGEGPPAPNRGPNRFPRAGTPPSSPERDLTPAPRPPTPTPATGGSDAYEARARTMLAQNDANTAREVLAAALVVYPRSKPLRSLYYVATALAALADGEVMLATSQLETALAHHAECTEAGKLLDHVKKHGAPDADVLKRVFR